MLIEEAKLYRRDRIRFVKTKLIEIPNELKSFEGLFNLDLDRNRINRIKNLPVGLTLRRCR
jgi:Leucine-rich repeat (LRR) protein